MKLKVLPPESAPWYADGLTFTCTQCGDCCTGGPGFVWVTDEEIRRVADHLRISHEEMLRTYCRRVAGKISFKERRQPNGNHDCIFLREVPAATPAGGRRELAPGEAIPLARRGCSVYSVRPLQCRTWPFWPENLAGRADWDRAARKCPGMNTGARHFTRERIEALRDTKEWPDNPPTSLAP